MLDFIPIVGKVIDKIFPDPVKQSEAKLKLLELQQNGDLKELEASLARDVAQIELNKVEASSGSIFKSGWRPFIGWTCGIGFAYAVIIYPILTWVVAIYGITSPPNLSSDILFPTMFGLLGLGGMRSFEKYKGITR